jgi:hypothetical protein
VAKHPAEFFLKYLIIKEGPQVPDAFLMKTLEDWSFLTPDPTYYGFLRQKISQPPQGFDPTNKLHRPSMKYLRDEGVYELFFPNEAAHQAWEVLSNPAMRLAVEQILLARLDLKVSCKRINAKHNWHLTAEGLELFRHFFWNVPLLTFDEWGRFLYGRSAMYDRYMGLLTAPPQLAYHHLRLEQTLESKRMIQRVQEIAYFALEEIDQRPGVSTEKVKAIGILGKTVIECHNALSTSDMALKDVLKQFERFRMEHPLSTPADIKQLAPGGNYTGSGADAKDGEKEKVH